MSKTKVWVLLIGLLVGLCAIAGVAYAADIVTGQDKTPRGISVGGVDISRMQRADAIAKLEAQLGDASAHPVTIHAGQRTATFVPADAGMTLNFVGAVDSIPQQSMNPFHRLAAFFGAPQEIDVPTDIDDAAFLPVQARLQDELRVDPTDGNVTLDGGRVNVTDAKLGQIVESSVLREAMSTQWLHPEGVHAEVTATDPVINQEKVEAMAQGDAATAVGKPLVLRGTDNATATVEPEQIATFARVERADDNLVIAVDNEAAKGAFGEPLAETETPGENARISFAGGTRHVTPSVDGTIIDWEPTLADLHARVVGQMPRQWDASYKDDPAEFTTADAEAATFDQVVGEFTTSGYSAASGRNIELTAQIVDGAVVSPGETFSLNNYTGPRGAAQGFVESGIIIDGHAGTAVGGGISQFATTLYNASYFAGMEDVTHTPHSYYISRYPAGREATVYEGAIDLQFKNTTPYPVQIRTSFGGGSITVQLMGVKTVDVQSTNNGRWAVTQPASRVVSGANCSPSSGAPGFTTSDTRTVRDLNGNVISQETQTTVYDPQPIVTCS
ncbi:MAG: VanW family protein [Corynebacterium sp.]|nr:VanW family protein [Corynebacterium sp.]